MSFLDLEEFDRALNMVLDEDVYLKRLEQGKMGRYDPQAAMDAFIRVLKEEIEESGSKGGTPMSGSLGPTAVRALLNIKHSSVQPGFDGQEEIGFYFADVQRPSLNPGKFPDGVYNLPLLLNNGYTTQGKKVYGYWASHDVYIENLRERSGAHFIEAAIQRFMRYYAWRYGVRSITFEGIYADEEYDEYGGFFEI